MLNIIRVRKNEEEILVEIPASHFLKVVVFQVAGQLGLTVLHDHNYAIQEENVSECLY
jgi:hypothetical protein